MTVLEGGGSHVQVRSWRSVRSLAMKVALARLWRV